MKVIGCVVVLLVGLSLASRVARSAEVRVVSYLVSQADPPEPWTGDPPLDARPCEWRIYDPASGRDLTFLHLAGSPTRIRWDASLRSVEFKLGRRICRAPWRPGATATVVVELPVDSTICGYWQDARDSSWNCAGARSIGQFERGGNTFFVSTATLWRSRDRGAHWDLLRSDSCLDEGCGCVAAWIPPAQAGAPIPLDALLDSMRIEHHPYRVLKAVAGSSYADALVAVPVRGMLDAHLELMQGEGDTDHAMLPVMYVDSKRGIRRTISPQNGAAGSQQIGFQQEGRYLLVAGEYDGASARVADLRSGKVVFVAAPGARSAVWVPWPR